VALDPHPFAPAIDAGEDASGPRCARRRTSSTRDAERKSRPCYIGDRFAVARMEPGGRSHEPVIVLDLRGIDKLATRPAPDRCLRSFSRDLGRVERYADVLGQELAHAASHIADAKRARPGQILRTRPRRELNARCRRLNRRRRFAHVRQSLARGEKPRLRVVQ
jgi:hypothetical protein